MSREEILAYLSSDWEKVLAYMDSALYTDVHMLDSVNLRIRSHSGKMLRPMVALLMAKACGQPNDDTYRYAAAIELCSMMMWLTKARSGVVCLPYPRCWDRR